MNKHFCAILVFCFLFANSIAFGAANKKDNYCLMKLFKTGVVAIFPQTGKVNFLCKLPKLRDYSVAGFDGVNNLQVIIKNNRAGYRRWYESLLYVNLESGEIKQFNPDKFNLYSSASYSMPIKKDVVAIMLWKYPTSKSYWVLYNLKNNTILNKNYRPKNNGGYISKKTTALDKWNKGWHTREIVKKRFPNWRAKYFRNVVKISRYYSFVLLVENSFTYQNSYIIDNKKRVAINEFYDINDADISKRAFLLYSGPDIKGKDDKLIANLTDYSFLIKGFCLSPSFDYFNTKEQNIRLDNDKFQELISNNTPIDGARLSRNEVLKDLRSWLKRGTNFDLSKELVFKGTTNTLSQIISKELKQNSRYSFLDIMVPFEYETLGKRYKFPVRIQFIVDQVKPEVRKEFYSPVIWFTLTKGKTQSSIIMKQ
jgi:hypothetical protein